MKLFCFKNQLIHKCLKDLYHPYYRLYKNYFECPLCCLKFPSIIGVQFQLKKTTTLTLAGMAVEVLGTIVTSPGDQLNEILKESADLTHLIFY